MFARCCCSKEAPVNRAANSAPVFKSSAQYSYPGHQIDHTSTVPKIGWSLANIPIFRIDEEGSVGAVSTRTLAHGVHPKLAVGAVSDPLEGEADRVAGRVMSMPAPHLRRAGRRPVSLPNKRSCGGSSEECQAEQTHNNLGRQLQLQPGTPIVSGQTSAPIKAPHAVREVMRSPGQSLEEATRAYFEPRFGRDLSGVRVHTDPLAGATALSMHALAYTLGSDIAFAPGEFQPGTWDGRTLIAHELAHVVQQDREPGVIHRKIKCDPRAKISGFLQTKGVSGFAESSSTYDYPKGGAAAATFEQELLIDMLASPRVFHVDGDSDVTASSSVAAHVMARTGIVSFASKKQYSFAALSGWKMNPALYDWDLPTGTWRVKPGVDPRAAWEDVNVNPTLYAIGCQAATDITQKGGSGGAKIIDMPSGDPADWIAGDAGFVKNTKYSRRRSSPGLEGENIIYTGGGMYWGHFTDRVTYRTLADWVAMVNTWNGGGGAKLDTTRQLPATGLLDQ
jgi:hypothetical protein